MISKKIRENLFFILPYLVILLMILPFLILKSKASIHLWLNGFHTAGLDWFFKIITFLGNGIFVVGLCIILLFYSLRHSVYFMSAYLAGGLFVQILKRLFFTDVARPVKYFQHLAQLHIVPGVEIHYSRSFPSGHSASAFSLFFCMAMITDNKVIKLICFLLACMVAYSRVYLSQHFLVDIYAGSVVGTIAAFGFYMIYFHTDKNWHLWSFQSFVKYGRKNDT